jgi:hypothetical protein
MADRMQIPITPPFGRADDGSKRALRFFRAEAVIPNWLSRGGGVPCHATAAAVVGLPEKAEKNNNNIAFFG